MTAKRTVASALAVVAAMMMWYVTWGIFAVAMLDLMVPTRASGSVALVLAVVQLCCLWLMWYPFRRRTPSATGIVLAGAAAGVFVRLCALQVELIREMFFL